MKIYAIKGNREEAITEAQEQEYLKAGYDIIKDGKRIPAPSKTVPYAEIEKLKKELDAEKAKVVELEKAKAELEKKLKKADKKADPADQPTKE